MRIKKMSNVVIGVLAVTPTALVVAAVASIVFGAGDHVEDVPAAEQGTHVPTETQSAPVPKVESEGAQVVDAAVALLASVATPLRALASMKDGPDEPDELVKNGSDIDDEAVNPSRENPGSRKRLSVEHEMLREALDDLEDLMTERSRRGHPVDVAANDAAVFSQPDFEEGDSR